MSIINTPTGMGEQKSDADVTLQLPPGASRNFAGATELFSDITSTNAIILPANTTPVDGVLSFDTPRLSSSPVPLASASGDIPGASIAESQTTLFAADFRYQEPPPVFETPDLSLATTYTEQLESAIDAFLAGDLDHDVLTNLVRDAQMAVAHQRSTNAANPLAEVSALTGLTPEWDRVDQLVIWAQQLPRSLGDDGPQRVIDFVNVHLANPDISYGDLDRAHTAAQGAIREHSHHWEGVPRELTDLTKVVRFAQRRMDSQAERTANDLQQLLDVPQAGIHYQTQLQTTLEQASRILALDQIAPRRPDLRRANVPPREALEALVTQAREQMAMATLMNPDDLQQAYEAFYTHDSPENRHTLNALTDQAGQQLADAPPARRNTSIEVAQLRVLEHHARELLAHPHRQPFGTVRNVAVPNTQGHEASYVGIDPNGDGVVDAQSELRANVRKVYEDGHARWQVAGFEGHGLFFDNGVGDQADVTIALPGARTPEEAAIQLRAQLSGHAADTMQLAGQRFADEANVNIRIDHRNGGLRRVPSAEFLAEKVAPMATLYETLKGDEGRWLWANDLANEVGMALGLATDIEPVTGEGSVVLYTDEAKLQAITRVTDVLHRLGGDRVNMTALPLFIVDPASGEAGLQSLIRVNLTGGEEKFVDHTGRVYNSFEQWKEDNQLPVADIYVARDGHLSADAHGNVEMDAFYTGNLEKRVMPIIDTGVMLLGAAGGVAGIIGTGGVAVPIVTTAGAVWSTGRGVSGMVDMGLHGESLNPLASGRARGAWLDTLGGALGVAAGRVASAVNGSSKLAHLSTVLSVASDSADALAMGGGIVQFVNNYDDMTPGQRVQAGASILFWGGMMGAGMARGRTTPTEGVYTRQNIDAILARIVDRDATPAEAIRIWERANGPMDGGEASVVSGGAPTDPVNPSAGEGTLSGGREGLTSDTGNSSPFSWSEEPLLVNEALDRYQQENGALPEVTIEPDDGVPALVGAGSDDGLSGADATADGDIGANLPDGGDQLPPTSPFSWSEESLLVNEVLDRYQQENGALPEATIEPDDGAPARVSSGADDRLNSADAAADGDIGANLPDNTGQRPSESSAASNNGEPPRIGESEAPTTDGADGGDQLPPTPPSGPNPSRDDGPDWSSGLDTKDRDYIELYLRNSPSLQMIAADFVRGGQSAEAAVNIVFASHGLPPRPDLDNPLMGRNMIGVSSEEIDFIEDYFTDRAKQVRAMEWVRGGQPVEQVVTKLLAIDFVDKHRPDYPLREIGEGFVLGLEGSLSDNQGAYLPVTDQDHGYLEVGRVTYVAPRWAYEGGDLKVLHALDVFANGRERIVLFLDPVTQDIARVIHNGKGATNPATIAEANAWLNGLKQQLREQGTESPIADLIRELGENISPDGDIPWEEVDDYMQTINSSTPVTPGFYALPRWELEDFWDDYYFSFPQEAERILDIADIGGPTERDELGRQLMSWSNAYGESLLASAYGIRAHDARHEMERLELEILRERDQTGRASPETLDAFHEVRLILAEAQADSVRLSTLPEAPLVHWDFARDENGQKIYERLDTISPHLGEESAMPNEPIDVAVLVPTREPRKLDDAELALAMRQRGLGLNHDRIGATSDDWDVNQVVPSPEITGLLRSPPPDLGRRHAPPTTDRQYYGTDPGISDTQFGWQLREQQMEELLQADSEVELLAGINRRQSAAREAYWRELVPHMTKNPINPALDTNLSPEVQRAFQAVIDVFNDPSLFFDLVQSVEQDAIRVMWLARQNGETLTGHQAWIRAVSRFTRADGTRPNEPITMPAGVTQEYFGWTVWKDSPSDLEEFRGAGHGGMAHAGQYGVVDRAIDRFPERFGISAAELNRTIGEADFAWRDALYEMYFPGVVNGSSPNFWKVLERYMAIPYS